MDKTRDVRRGANRQINQQSGHELVSGLNGVGLEFFLEKSKKLRRLSSVNVPAGPCNEGDSSDRENESHSPSKSGISGHRFRAPTMFYDELNAVDHACVPRKLRSAMKKPNHRSISLHSPKSKKRNRAVGSVEPCKKEDSIKKPEMKLKERITDLSPNKIASGAISKDEEEAVYSLFALAGMFRDDRDDGSCPVNPGIAIEDSVTTSSHPQAAQNESLSNVDNSNEQLISSNKTAYLEHRDLFERQWKHTEQDSYVPCFSLNHSTPSSTEDNKERPLFPETTCLPPEFSLDLGLKHSEQKVAPPVSILSISHEVTAMETHPVVQHMMKEPGENEGLTLWRGMFSTEPITAGSQSRPQSSVTKLPAPMQPTISSSRYSSRETCSSNLVSEVIIAKKAAKRSVAHVCISHLIQALKKQEGKGNLSLETNELNQHKELKGGVHFPLPNCDRVKPDGLSIIIAPTKPENFAASGNPCEVRNSSFSWHPKLHEDEAHFTTTQINSSKRSFDFLSLSTGDMSLEAKTAGKGPVPYLPGLPIQSILPSSMPQTHHPPSTYLNQIPAAASQVQAQLPQFLNTALSGTLHMSNSGISKQEQLLWAIQLSAKYRAVRTSTAQSQFPNRQLGKQASPTVKLSSTAFPTSSLDSILPKYSSVMQHQQQLMAGSSLPTEMLKIQHHLTPACEETGSIFRPQTGLTLQLL